MPLFRRKNRPKRHPFLAPPDMLERLAKYGEDRYFGKSEVWDIDSWPGEYRQALLDLPPAGQAPWLDHLAENVVSAGGWAAYGAEDLLLLEIEPDDRDTTAVGRVIEASLQFQRTSGIWWAQMSPAEHLWWQRNHPGEGWLSPQPIPERDLVQLTPLAVGEERRLNLLTRAPDGKMQYVVRVAEDRYQVQLDYLDGEQRGRRRHPQGDAETLFDMYLDFGRRVPFPGIWIDPELEPFLAYPMPRF